MSGITIFLARAMWYVHCGLRVLYQEPEHPRLPKTNRLDVAYKAMPLMRGVSTHPFQYALSAFLNQILARVRDPRHFLNFDIEAKSSFQGLFKVASVRRFTCFYNLLRKHVWILPTGFLRMHDDPRSHKIESYRQDNYVKPASRVAQVKAMRRCWGAQGFGIIARDSLTTRIARTPRTA